MESFYVNSQNVCFLSELKEEQIIDYLCTNPDCAAFLGQESGRVCPEGVGFEEHRGCMIIHAGSKARRKGSKARAGVFIALGPQFTQLWRRTGKLISYSMRHVALELRLHDHRICLASAYAPLSTSSFRLRSSFYSQLGSFALDSMNPELAYTPQYLTTS